MIDAEGGDVAGDDASDLKFLVGVKQQLDVAGEDSSLQAVRRVVDLAHGGVEIVVGLDRHDRGENFLAVYLHIRTRAGEDSRLEQWTGALSTNEQPRAGADGLFYPLASADGVAFANQRAEVGGFFQRISDFEALHPGQ